MTLALRPASATPLKGRSRRGGRRRPRSIRLGASLAVITFPEHPMKITFITTLCMPGMLRIDTIVEASHKVSRMPLRDPKLLFAR
jgi:hypothetical protein